MENDFPKEKDDKRVPIYHLIYGIIILALLAIFLIIVAPGHINEFAFSNFSFAATLISIVLAVVSIVYSLQSGLSNNSYKARMDEIQRNISNRMQELQEIEKSLRSLVEEHKENLKGYVGQSVSDVNKIETTDKGSSN